MIADAGAAPTTRILVVDDDPAMRRMIRLTLISEGFDVTMAADGVDGLECLSDGPFGLILLDLQMPGMDGRAMYAEMKRRGIDTPVLILSAYQAEAARLELSAAGAVSKPFDTSILIDRIHGILG